MFIRLAFIITIVINVIYSYCFFLCFEYLLNFLIIIITMRYCCCRQCAISTALTCVAMATWRVQIALSTAGLYSKWQISASTHFGSSLTRQTICTPSTEVRYEISA